MPINVEFGVPGTLTAMNGAVSAQNQITIPADWGNGPEHTVTVRPTNVGAMAGHVRFHAQNTPELLEQIRLGGIRYTGTVTLMFDKVLE